MQKIPCVYNTFPMEDIELSKLLWWLLHLQIFLMASQLSVVILNYISVNLIRKTKVKQLVNSIRRTIPENDSFRPRRGGRACRRGRNHPSQPQNARPLGGPSGNEIRPAGPVRPLPFR